MNNVLPEWEPVPWDADEVEAERQQAGFDLRTDRPIAWTPIAWPDLVDGLFNEPREWFVTRDVRFHAQHAGEDLVLIEHAWSGWPDPPRYALASRETARDDLPWQHWGCFDTLPDAWIILEQAERHAQDR